MRALRKSQLGSSLIELLVGMLLFSFLFGTALTEFFYTNARMIDNQLVADTQERARVVLDLMAYDIRLVGAGMPLGQINYSPTDALYGDAPLAVLLDSDGDYLRIRLDENSIQTVVAVNYSPSGTDLDITVVSAADFSVGDIIYISNMTTGRDDGFRGEIDEINANVITVFNTHTGTAGATFQAGSIVHKISEIIYSVDTGSGSPYIMRDHGSNALLVAPDATFTIEYLDEAGSIMTPPLTAADVANSLQAMNLSISVDSTRPRSSGGIYTATSSQTIMLRNLVINR